MFWDTTYILVILGAVLCAAASWNISQTYRRYSTFANRRGITAEAAAALLLQTAVEAIEVPHDDASCAVIRII